MPGGAWSKGTSLASGACGAWSVATASMVPSAEPAQHGGHVGVGAQRRVDLEDRVVARDRGVGEQQVVRRHLGGHRQPLGLGPPHQLDRAGRRQVQEVHRAPRSAGPAPGRGPPSPPRRRPGCRAARAGSTTRLVHGPAGGQARRPRSAGPGSTPRPPAYSRARRISAPSCTPAPSSVNSAHAERGQLAQGASALAGPTHGDGAGHRHLAQRAPGRARAPRPPPRPSRWAARCWAWPRPRCSPRARRPGLPVSTVSASSRPGWRRWVCRSTRPGADEATRGVEHRGAGRASRSARRTTARRRRRPADAPVVDAARPVDDRRHRDRRSPASGPPADRQLTATRSTPRPEEEEQHGHPHRHAVGHLPGDHRAGQVGHVGGDLDPADHRPGVGDHGVVGQSRARPAVSPQPAVYSRSDGHERPAPPLGLQPQQVARRRPRAGPRRGRGTPSTGQPSRDGGSRLPGAARITCGPEGGVGQHLGAGHPAVADVAHDRTRRPSKQPPRAPGRPRARPAPGAP